MRRALIFNGSFVMVPALLVLFLKGKQARKEMDDMKLMELNRPAAP
jgi:FLVCR family MFS transporter 7